MEVKEQEAPKKKTLEIGSGSHRFDDPKEDRTYLDLDLSLARRQRKWGIVPNKLDTVEANIEQGLSFKEGSFDEVQILFPSGVLINSLLGRTRVGLWPEVARVLKPSGLATIVVEDKHRSYRTNELLIDQPQELIVKQAELSGFKTEVERVNQEELDKLGTNSAKAAAENLRRDNGAVTVVYKITASK